LQETLKHLQLGFSVTWANKAGIAKMFGSSFARLAMLHLKYTPVDDSEMHGAEPERAGAAKSAPADDSEMHGAEPARSGDTRSARSGRHALVAGTAVLALRWSLRGRL
jgi:hypothetical protein